MIVCGIDPGLNGAIALMDTPMTVAAVWDMPTLALVRGGKNKREVDAHGLTRLLADNPIGHAFVERMGAMPGQGVTSTFALGKGYGVILGVLSALGVPYTVIDSRKWKRALLVPAAKDGARARASQLLPSAAHQWPLVKHDGRAESALIALYGIFDLNSIADGRAA